MFPGQQQQQLLQAAMLSPFLANPAAAGERPWLGLRGVPPAGLPLPGAARHVSKHVAPTQHSNWS